MYIIIRHACNSPPLYIIILHAYNSPPVYIIIRHAYNSPPLHIIIRHFRQNSQRAANPSIGGYPTVTSSR